MRKITLFLFIVFFISTTSEAQIYFPLPGSSSGNNNVGINQATPTSRLHISDITTFGQCVPGILVESSYTSEVTAPGGGDGGEEPPLDCTTPFAFRNTTLSSGLNSITFNIAANGQTQIGNLSGLPIALGSFLSVENSIGVYNSSSDLVQLGIYPLAGLVAPSLIWDSGTELPMRFGYGTGSYYSPVLTLTTSDFVGVNTASPLAALHVVSSLPSPNDGDIGQIQGLLIENNGYRNHDFAFEIRTGQLPLGATMTNGRVFTVSNAGTVIIGPMLNWETPETSKGAFKLYVQDGIRTEKVRVDIASVSGWADFVFDPNYDLPSLQDEEEYILQNGRLRNIPSAEEVVEEGIDLAEMNKLLLQKIEELTLHLIEMEKKIKTLEDEAR